MEKIQMVDLHKQYARIKPEIDHAIEKVLTSTAFIQGPDVQEFARALARYLDVPAVIPCANGTDALQIAMMALSFKPGDEIILPVHTYVATAEVIALLGLTPVFAEVRADSFTLDPERLEEKITSRTVAIVPVHLYGQCADMAPLLRIAQKHNLHIIEDAAQALGADYTFPDKSVKKAGTMGTIGTTSFFPSKNLGCYGDGGAIFTNDEALATKIRMIANHGQQVKYHHDLVGVNSRLDTLQAAILQVKLPYLDDYARRRNEVAAFYDRVLANVPYVTIPWRAPYSTHVFHQYTLQIGNGKRDALKQNLEQQGIPTMIYYPVPLHLQKAYQQPDAGPGTFPLTEMLSQTVISLPIHTEMEASQLEYIGDAITRFF
ncbi:DegT/DnrJ/EryC1/StrS family aminotransferase [Fulvivirgaceae bacterium PWU5]|uniref:DegT/DnrJ/EryC1/StrS family aminotransferase n=1 Tax=Dawidia cretensis TaxID=2782350 RepID=A0AAP2E5F8_9BACT|nr:DegT/DnrJ/EryC1/StrS family aminotransferase [Dawidia cretensis]MBT1712219.1 DegT/DnrJ/EryC1/StrS family aminotransferase [Dawidia cretensis]